jgi:F0F1-type ATP synthase assembly protein I
VPLLIAAAFAGLARAPRRLSVREIATRRGLRRFAVGVTVGAGIGFLLAFGDRYIAGGLIVGVAVGLTLGVNTTDLRITGPQ